MKSEQGRTFLARNVSRAFWAIAFVCLLSTLVVGCDKLPEEPWELVHIAQGGESLWSIGARYGTVPDALAAFNGSSSEVFEAGVRVSVPYRVITKNEMENVYRMGKHDSFDSYYDPDSELDRDVRAIIGDHDGDGNPTIIFAPQPSHDYGAGGKVARVFGMEIREQGSPVVLSRETFTKARVGVSLQLRDVAFDDKLELIIVYRPESWHDTPDDDVRIPHRMAVVVDLETGSSFDLTPLSRYGEHWAFEQDPFIGDLDGDGSLEIVFHSIYSKTALVNSRRPSGRLEHGFTVYSTTPNPILNDSLTQTIQNSAAQLLNTVRDVTSDNNQEANVRLLLDDVDAGISAYLRRVYGEELEPFLHGRPWTNIFVGVDDPPRPASYQECKLLGEKIWIKRLRDTRDLCATVPSGRYETHYISLFDQDVHIEHPQAEPTPLSQYNGIKFEINPVGDNWRLEAKVNREWEIESNVTREGLRKKFSEFGGSGNYQRLDVDNLEIRGNPEGVRLRFELGNEYGFVLREDRLIDIPRNVPLIVEVRHVMGFYQARVFAKGETRPEWQLQTYRPHYTETTYGGSLAIRALEESASIKNVEVYFDERMKESDRRGMHRALSRLVHATLHRHGGGLDAKRAALIGTFESIAPGMRQSALEGAFGHMIFFDRAKKLMRPFGSVLEEYRAEKARAGIGTDEINPLVGLAVDLVDAKTGSLLSVDNDLNRFVKEVITDVVYEAGRATRFDVPDNNAPDSEGKYWQSPTDLPIYVKVSDEEAQRISDRFNEVRSEEIEFIKGVEAQASEFVNKLLGE